MDRRLASLKLFKAALLLGFTYTWTASADAQTLARRTWVSGAGNDANPCTQDQPCQTFARALALTAEGGKIDCANAGGFGVVTITKSVTIDCRSVVASILAPGGDGIFVNAPGAQVVVRGLTVNGGPSDNPGRYGIYVLAAQSVTLSDIVVENFAVPGGIGLVFSPNAASLLTVSNTTLLGNGTRTAGGGILIRPRASATATVALDKVQSVRNGQIALAIDNLSFPTASSIVTVNGGDFSNGDYGIIALTGGAGSGAINVVASGTRITGNAVVGVRSGGSATAVLVSNALVSGNSVGLDAQSGGALVSVGGNVVAGNGSNGAFTATSAKN